MALTKDSILTRIIATILVIVTFATLVPAGFSVRAYENEPAKDNNVDYFEHNEGEA